MRAKTVNENNQFERGQDPKSSMGIGRYKDLKDKDFDIWNFFRFLQFKEHSESNGVTFYSRGGDQDECYDFKRIYYFDEYNWISDEEIMDIFSSINKKELLKISDNIELLAFKGSTQQSTYAFQVVLKGDYQDYIDRGEEETIEKIEEYISEYFMENSEEFINFEDEEMEDE